MTEAPTIFITGATDGLGRALASRLAADGATLILHGRDAGKLESTAAGIAATHGVDHPRTVRADMADLTQVRKLALDVQNATGRFYDRTREARAAAQAYDAGARAELWRRSLELTGHPDIG